ncbi:MAG: hypothetical protein WD845_09520 [Pirellulales bacterium]
MINRFDDRHTIEPHERPAEASGVNSVVGAGRAFFQRVEHVVSTHPKHSLIVAALAGAAIGWISKRR